MTGLKDLLKKKEKIALNAQADPSAAQAEKLDVPQFTFLRTTTESEEIIEPPGPPDDEEDTQPKTRALNERQRKHRSLGFRKSSNASITKDPTAQGRGPETSPQQLPIRPKGERRLSQRLGLHRERSRSAPTETSTNLPRDLPAAPDPISPTAGNAEEIKAMKEQREAQWEKRATLLAQSNSFLDDQQKQDEKRSARSKSPTGSISDQHSDENIQTAITLHESGDLAASSEMFGRLSRPDGANNALAQVLYGLALRHGWGIPPDPTQAIHYLSLAASNSASIEEAALQASGMQKGGAAKGELVLAIFELANCFRHGWGVKKDAVAARQYYETAANLGDMDAMEEAAWCYLEGFGGGKDKHKAAQFLRLAEEKGSKSVGNSWIWKEKYNPK